MTGGAENGADNTIERYRRLRKKQSPCPTGQGDETF